MLRRVYMVDQGETYIIDLYSKKWYQIYNNKLIELGKEIGDLEKKLEEG